MKSTNKMFQQTIVVHSDVSNNNFFITVNVVMGHNHDIISFCTFYDKMYLDWHCDNIFAGICTALLNLRDMKYYMIRL